jgi:hypothetical protein
MSKFKIGDKVTFINEYGIKFPERTIIGLDTQQYGDCLEPRYFFGPDGAYWVSSRESLFIHDKDDPVICEVFGHKIRNVFLPGYADAWFLVGTTGEAFSTLDAAIEWAEFLSKRFLRLTNNEYSNE